MIGPFTNPLCRVWTLLRDGVAVGFYTDHCQRPFARGDMLRDDHDFRRRVLAVISSALLTLSVTSPDVMSDPCGR